MSESTNSRRRTYHWQDPRAAAAQMPDMTGLEFLQAMRNGRLPRPPISAALGYRFTSVSDGEAIFTLEPGEHLFNPIGSVHGGVYAVLLDSAMSCAVQTRLPRGVGYTTLEYKINLVRPMQLDSGPLQAIGRAVHVGRRVGTATGELVDEAGKIYAHGSTTCLIFPLP